MYDLLAARLEEIKPENTSLTFKPLDIYQREGDEEHKQIAFRLSIMSYNRTLTDQEINLLLEKASQTAKEKLGAERI